MRNGKTVRIPGGVPTMSAYVPWESVFCCVLGQQYDVCES